MTITPGPKISAGGITKFVTTQFTRPNNTTAYTANFVISDSTSQGSILVFPNCARYPGGSGLIQSVCLSEAANQTTKLDADLFIFSAIVAGASLGNDGAVFVPSFAQLLYRVACIQLPSSNVRTANNTGAGASGNVVNDIGNLALPFMCADNDDNLYGSLIARNAYTPVANTVFAITLGILQD